MLPSHCLSHSAQIFFFLPKVLPVCSDIYFPYNVVEDGQPYCLFRSKCWWSEAHWSSEVDMRSNSGQWDLGRGVSYGQYVFWEFLSLKGDTVRDRPSSSSDIHLSGCNALMCYRHTALPLMEAKARQQQDRERRKVSVPSYGIPCLEAALPQDFSWWEVMHFLMIKPV